MLDPLAAYLAQARAEAKEGTSLTRWVVMVGLMTQSSVRQVASNWHQELRAFT